jgi:hypothetical protein
MLRLVEFGAHPCNRAQNSDPALEPRDQLAGNRKAVLHLEPSPISHGARFQSAAASGRLMLSSDLRSAATAKSAATNAAASISTEPNR